MTASQILRAAMADFDVADSSAAPFAVMEPTAAPAMIVVASEPDRPQRQYVRKGGYRGAGSKSWSRVDRTTVTLTDKGVKLQFAAKPPDDVRRELHASRWWFTQGYWLHPRTEAAVAQAYRLAQ